MNENMRITHILRCSQAIVSLIAHFMPGDPDYSHPKMLPSHSQLDSSFHAR